MAIGNYSMRERWFEGRTIWDHRPLFRARHLLSDEWVVGYFYMDWEPYGMPPDACIIPYDNIEITHSVDADTLTRYIGCKDLNGTMIFDGDIVECWNGNRCLVEIDGLGGAFLRAGLFGYRFPFHTAGEPASCTVVGNIFDNPEMVDAIQKKSDDETNAQHDSWRKEIIRVDRVKGE